MTKLEQKLIQLGYRKTLDYYYKKYEKKKYGFSIVIEIITINGRRQLNPFLSNCYIGKQQDIDKLQQAFNQLQNDLKELKEYE